MTAEKQMQVLNLYKGQPLKRAIYALNIAQAHTAQKTLELRIKVVGLVISD